MAAILLDGCKKRKEIAVELLNPELTDVVCWTRMHAESGQDIQSIIARKDVERRAGGGLFFWGVGNPPSRAIRGLASKADTIDVVFSIMKTKPKRRDSAPSGILAWRTYFDVNGVETPIPPHVLVTSRMENSTGMKKVHYALMCQSHDELCLSNKRPFDPSAYRNVGDAGRPISPSQVTALAVRICAESPVSDYRINLRARLTGSYWVKLGRPCVISENGFAALNRAAAFAPDVDTKDWVEVVSQVTDPFDIEQQPSLF